MFIHKKFIFLIVTLFIFTEKMCNSAEEDEKLKVISITKSFNPQKPAVVPAQGYRPYSEPKGDLSFDEQRQMLIYKENTQNQLPKQFSLIWSNGLNVSLAVDVVAKNSYQWAFFGTQEYLDTPSRLMFTKFSLLSSGDGTYRIECENRDEKSYLAVKLVSSGSFQWAFFATQQYLDNNKGIYSQNFSICPYDDGTYSVRCLNNNEVSYLSVNKAKANSYEWAFFDGAIKVEENNSARVKFYLK